MKITRGQLRQIIKEELLREQKDLHTQVNYPPVEWPDVERTISTLQKDVDSGRPKSGDDDFDAKMAAWEKKSDSLKKYKRDLANSKKKEKDSR